jgi:L-cysteine desulfidase
MAVSSLLVRQALMLALALQEMGMAALGMAVTMLLVLVAQGAAALITAAVQPVDAMLLPAVAQHGLDAAAVPLERDLEGLELAAVMLVAMAVVAAAVARVKVHRAQRLLLQMTYLRLCSQSSVRNTF